MRESAELRAMLEGMYDAMAESDVAWLDRALSPGDETVAIGTDPDEWWEGGDTVRDKLRKQFDAGLSGARFEATRLSAYEEGDVGWASDEPRVALPGGGTATVRVTAVFRRVDGAWRIVQNHASFGVPNQQSIGMDLPT